MKFFLSSLLLISMLSPIVSAQLRTVDLPSYYLSPGDAPRLFAYTNKQSAFYCGVLNGTNTSGFHGITLAKRKLFEQYWIRLGDTLLDPATAEISVTPAGFTRRYPLHNTVEHVFFADSIALLAVSISTDYRGDAKVYPGWSAGWRNPVESIGGGMYRLREDASKDGALQGAAVVQGLDGDWEVARESDVAGFPNPSPLHMPVMFWGHCGGQLHLTIEIAPAEDRLGRRPPPALFTLRKQRELRMTDYLTSLGFACSDSATTDAFQWIAASMDALVMHQTGAGIYAGLPWFDDYWGRDTFISFPGALLVTGQFGEAKRVLRSFIQFMDRDTASATYGRIPNRVQPDDIIYNTVDGTPWMVIQAWEYFRYTGDSTFMQDIYPDIARTVEGAMRHTDSLGFLTHADAETWMDAVGPEGPWSPRGNRAVDIQALWIGQLRAAASMAALVDDTPQVKDWRALADSLTARLVRHFSFTRHSQRVVLNPGMPGTHGSEAGASLLLLADHLNTGGSKDTRDRPNVLFPLTLLGIDTIERYAPGLSHDVIRNTFASCIYRWGVASLGQSETDFHPFHEAPRSYPKDAAYHNGTIWTWLTGVAVSALCEVGLQDSAWVLMRTLERLAMETGAVGTIPENSDALPRAAAAHPRWSGTFSQAWSNAEYLRVMYRDILGITPDAASATLTIAPALPQVLPWAEAVVHVGGQRLRVHVKRAASGAHECTVTHLHGDASIHLITAGSNSPHHLTPGAEETIFVPARDLSEHDRALGSRFGFCRPRSLDGIAAIAPPPWPHIDGATATASNNDAEDLCSAFDSEGDDHGPNGRYTYPQSGLFRPGSFDLRHFRVSADEHNVYFSIQMRALSQPGWHPEYGFQLTMLAIAIDQSHDPSQQSWDIGHNSGYRLPENRGYDRLILVGGGVQVRDTEGNILAEFIPETRADAFGNADSGIISFAIPRIHLGGGFDHWQYTIIAGAQDDHGGAGIGEFRTVMEEAGEWHGGGADSERSENRGAHWYDVMHCP